jgi:RNA polymerase sigma factor (sigma-70 family)
MRFRQRAPRLGEQEPDDMDQAVALALVKAAGSWSPEKSEFSHWCSFQILHAMQQEYRNSKVVKPPKRVVDGTSRVMSAASQQKAAACCRIVRGSFRDEDEIRLNSFVTHDTEVTDLFERVKKLLPKRESAILAMAYRDGLTDREIAKEVGLSIPRIQTLHTRALIKLRRALDKENLDG